MSKQLPAEVILHITSYLSLEDALQLSRINHHWFEIIVNHFCRHLTFRDFRNLEQFLHLFYETAKNRKHGITSGFFSANDYPRMVRTIDFSRMHSKSLVTNDIARRLLEDCSHLESLNLYNCHRLVDSTVRLILQKCPGIQHLYLAGATYLTAACLPRSGAVRLKTLNIYMLSDFFERLQRTQLHELANKLPALSTLKTSNLCLGFGTSFKDLARGLPSLQYFRSFQIHPRKVNTFLSDCTQLNTVEVVSSRFDAKSLKHLKLVHLNIAHTRLENAHDLYSSLANSLSQMTTLVLTGVKETTISSNQLIRLLCSMPRLARFFAPRALDDRAVLALIDRCPSITSLAIMDLQRPISAKMVQKVLDVYQKTFIELRLTTDSLRLDDSISLDAILVGWPSSRLQHLILNMEYGFCGSMLLRLATLYPSLRVLRVKIDESVSMMVVEKMVVSLPCLEAMNIHYSFDQLTHSNVCKELELNYHCWEQKDNIW